MASLAAALKREITRLARKEIKAQVAPVQKRSAQHRREIAALKRQVAALERELTSLRRRKPNDAVKTTRTPKKRTRRKRRTLGRGVKSHRKRLGMTASDYAKFLGVQPQTIYNWEQGKTRPGPEQDAALVEFQKIGKREAWRRLAMLKRQDGR